MTDNINEIIQEVPSVDEIRNMSIEDLLNIEADLDIWTHEQLQAYFETLRAKDLNRPLITINWNETQDFDMVAYLEFNQPVIYYYVFKVVDEPQKIGDKFFRSFWTKMPRGNYGASFNSLGAWEDEVLDEKSNVNKSFQMKGVEEVEKV